MKKKQEILSASDFTRLANNFYNSSNLEVPYERIAIDSQFFNYVATHQDELKKKFKVALCCISLNPLYWEYIKDMIDGVKQFFLPGHDVDVLFWSDIPKPDDPIFPKLEEQFLAMELKKLNDQGIEQIPVPHFEALKASTKQIVDRAKAGAQVALEQTVFPLEPIEWPLPTLMRFHTMLQQEEKLKEYDYIFYCDIDMKFVNIVGDEILGSGLTAAQHPMYALSKENWPPYEPNKESSAHIKRPGRVINDGGKPRFMPLYFAGGFQGGKSEEFIKAMKAMKKIVDADFAKNYIPIWNDESVWNKYLEDVPENLVVLTPSYIYPDSLVKEYYEPRWGQSYQPKIITITKKFTLTKEGAENSQKLIQGFRPK